MWKHRKMKTFFENSTSFLPWTESFGGMNAEWKKNAFEKVFVWGWSLSIRKMATENDCWAAFYAPCLKHSFSRRNDWIIQIPVLTEQWLESRHVSIWFAFVSFVTLLKCDSLLSWILINWNWIGRREWIRCEMEKHSQKPKQAASEIFVWHAFSWKLNVALDNFIKISIHHFITLWTLARRLENVYVYINYHIPGVSINIHHHQKSQATTI